MKNGYLVFLLFLGFACSKTDSIEPESCPVFVAESLGSTHNFLQQKWVFQFYSDNGPYHYAPCLFNQNSPDPTVWLRFSQDSNTVYPFGFDRLQYDYTFQCGPKSLDGTYTQGETNTLQMGIYPIETMEYIEGVTPFRSELSKRISKVEGYRLLNNILQLTYPGGYLQFAIR
ncbi:MAG: hypothetical protein EP332_15060 [Bacteroidetes bacterium]|nr:MAG: hypothetical protein EP332_15060 [Bacteroidota bacterium]